jgi:hypothetical protein
MRGRRGVSDRIPQEQCAIVGANIRVLRQRSGWTQARLGELMGWPTNSTVCAAEGHRSDRQRAFTTSEVQQLAAIFGISPLQLTMQCSNCGGRPPAGFACLACGTALPSQARHGHAVVSGG